MAPPSRSYSALSSPLFPSVGCRHTLEKTFLSSRVQSPSVLMWALT
uniref:RBOHD n=1 Tax=Arundo donax TaxID=35708 RepID=A0A0A8XRJ6_ARUDO